MKLFYMDTFGIPRQIAKISSDHMGWATSRCLLFTMSKTTFLFELLLLSVWIAPHGEEARKSMSWTVICVSMRFDFQNWATSGSSSSISSRSSEKECKVKSNGSIFKNRPMWRAKPSSMAFCFGKQSFCQSLRLKHWLVYLRRLLILLCNLWLLLCLLLLLLRLQEFGEVQPCEFGKIATSSSLQNGESSHLKQGESSFGERRLFLK